VDYHPIFGRDRRTATALAKKGIQRVEKLFFKKKINFNFIASIDAMKQPKTLPPLRSIYHR